MRPILSFAAVAWFAAAVTPSAVTQESKAHPITALKAARLFDGKSGALQSNGMVLVQGPKIIAAGRIYPSPPGPRLSTWATQPSHPASSTPTPI